mgnify:CR=1 FL=1
MSYSLPSFNSFDFHRPQSNKVWFIFHNSSKFQPEEEHKGQFFFLPMQESSPPQFAHSMDKLRWDASAVDLTQAKVKASNFQWTTDLSEMLIIWGSWLQSYIGNRRKKGQIGKSVAYENVIVRIDLTCFEWPIQMYFSLIWKLEQFNWKVRNSELKN